MGDAMTDLDGLLAEKKRLDDLLDDALDKFALYEEKLNAQFKNASPEDVQVLMAERAQVEDMLGIADLVTRLDELREAIQAARV